ncbi:MAG: hypothetical protein PUP92_32935 [Rhizonema sp. PD38]|nr:hypothetical protein [Rhizonema sp. PD38]
MFAAQAALEDEIKWLREKDGFLQKGRVGVQECTRLLNENVANKKNQLRKIDI